MATIRRAVYDETAEDGGQDVQFALTHLALTRSAHPTENAESIGRLLNAVDDNATYVTESDAGKVTIICQIHLNRRKQLGIVRWLFPEGDDFGDLAPTLAACLVDLVTRFPEIEPWRVQASPDFGVDENDVPDGGESTVNRWSDWFLQVGLTQPLIASRVEMDGSTRWYAWWTFADAKARTEEVLADGA